MWTRARTRRLVALIAALSVSLATAGPVLADARTEGACAREPEHCARTSVGSPCCCGGTDSAAQVPLLPRAVPAAGAPATIIEHPLPSAPVNSALPLEMLRRGHHSVALHTLLSILLI